MALNLLFPPKCMVCGRRIDVAENILSLNCICDKCRPNYEMGFYSVCGECNLAVSVCTCGAKIGKREISPIAKCFYYKPDCERGTHNRIIYSLKHRDDKRFSRFLGRELSSSVGNMLSKEGIDPDLCIFTYVPRRREAINKDGFDQGKRLARYTAFELGMKRSFRTLIIRRDGDEQKKLNKVQRQKNLENSLRLRRGVKLSGKTVCVIDDVVTSGATMLAAEKLLITGGAERVVFACVARSRSEK